MISKMPARQVLTPEIEGKLRSLALILSSVAEEAADHGLEQSFLLLREARQMLLDEARKYYGLEL
ncbi:hypothetical protein [Roseomonas sp. AR75]|uniref:hypothetical protein n=1 Tax=Roseomonas sp. AR75 TaxID=2562311 RepID=UPI0010C010E3|nr:hypothetical protein [Roseomonas sp. AR75]